MSEGEKETVTDLFEKTFAIENFSTWVSIEKIIWGVTLFGSWNNCKAGL